MGTFVALKLAVDLSRRSGAAIFARDVVETFPGTRNVALDADGNLMSFELLFPGNLSALVRRLENGRIPVADRADISLPVRSTAPDLLRGGASAVTERLLEGAEVWDPQFERARNVFAARLSGDRLEATIIPSSSSMHGLYDALLGLGLVASDAPAAGHGV